jgi:hypothetical protein
MRGRGNEPEHDASCAYAQEVESASNSSEAQARLSWYARSRRRQRFSNRSDRLSLAFRKNEAAIRRGDVPDKYTRLLPFITGKRILEIGSAEGVLSLLLAAWASKSRQSSERERHEARPTSIPSGWRARSKFTPPTFVNGDIADNLWTC